MSLIRSLGQDLSELVDKIQNVEKHSYRYWRIRIILSSLVAYAAFYLVRSNFSMAIPVMTESLGYTKTELGFISSAFGIVYGFGKLINGFLSDRLNARYFIVVGLMGSAILNVCMGFSTGLTTFFIFWVVNAWFQSMGWPPAARMLTQWFSPSEIGTKWAFWASSHQLGAATIFALTGYLLAHFGWQSAFWVPGILAAFLAVFSFDRLRDNPREMGFPAVEEYKQDVEKADEKEQERLSLKEVLPIVLKNKWVWCAAVANICLYIPRMGIFTWAPTFLKEYKGVDLVIAGWQLAGFEMAGLVGGIVAGWLSDKVFDGRRGPVGAIFMGFVALFMFLLWIVPPGYAWLDTLILICAGFSIYGPQVLAGLAAVDFSSKRAAGVATGLIGVLAYVFSSMTGYGIGRTVDLYGWNAAFILFIITGLVGSFFFALTWNQRSKILKHKNKQVGEDA